MSAVPQLIINSLISGAIYVLLALGFNFIYDATKFFNLAYGATAAIGGYVVFFLMQSLGLNIFLSIAIAILAAGFVGYALDKTLYSRLRKKKASSMIFLVASLGIFTVIQALLAILFTSQFQILNTNQTNVYQIGSGSITDVQIVIIAMAVMVSIGLALLIKKTKFGRVIRAVSDDEEVSKIVGINTNQIIGRVFFIGSSIAGLAGILVGFDVGIDPNMGLSLLLKGVIASIVGGIGNIYGAIAGGLLLGFAENFGIWKISGEWKDAIAFVVLIIFLLFRPQGILRKL